MDTYTLSFSLGLLGIVGIITLVLGVGWVLWQYRNSQRRTFRWRMRNWRFMQLTGLACLFFLAMAASYAVLQEAWAWIYVLVAFKTGVWWFRYALGRA